MAAGIPPFNPETAGPGYLYVHVADHVARRIDAGELAPGAMLPGERAMAEEYHVAIGTIRSAIDELRSRGLVVTYPGKGTYVAEK